MNCPPYVPEIELPSVRASRLRREARQATRRRWIARCVGLLLTLAVIVVLAHQASAAPPMVGKSFSLSIGPPHAGMHVHGPGWHGPAKHWSYVQPIRPVPYPYHRTYYGPVRYAPLAPTPLLLAPLPTNTLPSGPPLEIVNPAESPGEVNYTLGGRVGSLSPGEVARLPYKANQVIEFHRGGQFGKARYRLSGGAYRFALTDHGWELYRQ